MLVLLGLKSKLNEWGGTAFSEYSTLVVDTSDTANNFEPLTFYRSNTLFSVLITLYEQGHALMY